MGKTKEEGKEEEEEGGGAKKYFEVQRLRAEEEWGRELRNAVMVGGGVPVKMKQCSQSVIASEAVV